MNHIPELCSSVFPRIDIHLFNKYLLSTYYVSALSIQGTSGKKNRL